MLGKRPDLELSVEPSILRRCEREGAIQISTKPNRPPVQSNMEVMTMMTRKFHVRAADVVNWRLNSFVKNKNNIKKTLKKPWSGHSAVRLLLRLSFFLKSCGLYTLTCDFGHHK